MQPQDVYPPLPQPGQGKRLSPLAPRANDPLFLYKVGLLVIGLFTLVITIVALVGASAAKQDTQTEKNANTIATKLDSYITVNQKVPSSLAVAGIRENTSHISYTKLSDTNYKFCVTYKAASSTSTNPIDDLTGQSIYKKLAASYSGTYNDSSYLYISPVHKKGENCQTVRPYLDGSSYDSSSSSSSSLDTSDYQFDTQNTTSDLSDPKTSAQEAASKEDVCYFTGYKTHYSGTVTKINGSQDDGSDFDIKVQPDSGGPSGEQTVTVKANDTSTFRNGCGSMYGSSFSVGDAVAVFIQNKDSFMPDVIIDYSDEQ
jgi:type II secretory pathway pseudopilin PulG